MSEQAKIPGYLGKCEILHIHDDGDLTIKCGGKKYVVTTEGEVFEEVMTESEKWQAMMASCRKACRILGEEFKEPEYLNWSVGAHYHDDLWARVGKTHKERMARQEKSLAEGKRLLVKEREQLERLAKKRPEGTPEEWMTINPNNPVDLSNIRGELVRLETDLEGKKPYLSKVYRESVEGAISRIKMCDLRGALDQSMFAFALAGSLIKDTELTTMSRVDNISNQLKDKMVEIAIEACQCKFEVPEIDDEYEDTLD